MAESRRVGVAWALVRVALVVGVIAVALAGPQPRVPDRVCEVALDTGQPSNPTPDTGGPRPAPDVQLRSSCDSAYAEYVIEGTPAKMGAYNYPEEWGGRRYVSLVTVHDAIRFPGKAPPPRALMVSSADGFELWGGSSSSEGYGPVPETRGLFFLSAMDEKHVPLALRDLNRRVPYTYQISRFVPWPEWDARYSLNDYRALIEELRAQPRDRLKDCGWPGHRVRPAPRP